MELFYGRLTGCKIIDVSIDLIIYSSTSCLYWYISYQYLYVSLSCCVCVCVGASYRLWHVDGEDRVTEEKGVWDPLGVGELFSPAWSGQSDSEEGAGHTGQPRLHVRDLYIQSSRRFTDSVMKDLWYRIYNNSDRRQKNAISLPGVFIFLQWINLYSHFF